MRRKTFILGSRGSLLAIWQAEWVKKQLEKLNPGIAVEIKKIVTSGDKFRGTNWTEFPDKGVFIKEIEEALLSKDIDIAVHSLKDVPTELPQGLYLAAIPKRADVHDVMLFNTMGRVSIPDSDGEETMPIMDMLPEKAIVGTSSLRRQSQLLHFRPDLVMMSLRGNLTTRVTLLEQGDFDAIVVAAAGLNRLNIKHPYMVPIPLEVMLPAVGQGALAIECRIDDDDIDQIVSRLNNKPTELAVTAERAFLAGLGGGCRLPIAAYGRVEQKQLKLDGLVANPDGSKFIRSQGTTKSLTLAHATILGEQLAQKLLHSGAARLLDHGI
ncbi:MAG: hydroxymethylbilane synthase [bacterium]